MWNGRKNLIEYLVTAAEHESQNEFVMSHEIIEHPNEIETKEALKGSDNVKLIWLRSLNARKKTQQKNK